MAMPRTISTMIGLCLVGTSAAAAPEVPLPISPLSTSVPPRGLSEVPVSFQPADRLPGLSEPETNKTLPLQRLAETRYDSRWARSAEPTQVDQAQGSRRVFTRSAARAHRTAQANQSAIPLPRPAPLLMRHTELSPATPAFVSDAPELTGPVSGVQLAQGPAITAPAAAVPAVTELPIVLLALRSREWAAATSALALATSTMPPAASGIQLAQTAAITETMPVAPATTKPPPSKAPMQVAQTTGTIPSTNASPSPSPVAAAVSSAETLPRSRNEPPPVGASTSYTDRVAGYWNDAVDYVGGGLSSLAGYLPNWSIGWSSSEDTTGPQSRERLLVEAMNSAGFELASATREGTLVTTVTYTFRQQRKPSPSERLLAAKLAADLAAVSGGIGGYFEQSMIKSAIEGGEASALNIQTFELQTRPYPSLRSVAGPRSATR